jgi:hypothetical protein
MRGNLTGSAPHVDDVEPFAVEDALRRSLLRPMGAPARRACTIASFSIGSF